MFRNFEELRRSVVSDNPKTLVVASAHDKHTLEAVYEAATTFPMNYVLVGDKSRILEISKGLGKIPADEKIVEARDDVDCAKKSIDMIRMGKGDVLMKGLMETGTLLKAVLNKEEGIRGTGTMSHLAVLEIKRYKKLIGITDGGMIPYPTLEQKADIIRNAVGFYHGLGAKVPMVSVLAASESVSEKMPETVDGEKLQEMCRAGELGDCLLEGPLSFDISVSKESADIKKHPSKIAGEVDIMLAPSIAAGNILSKGLIYWGGAKMAGCVLGAKVPIVLVSRGATAEEKLLSIMLCIKAG